MSNAADAWVAACVISACLACAVGWWRVAALLAVHAGAYVAATAIDAACAVG